MSLRVASRSVFSPVLAGVFCGLLFVVLGAIPAFAQVNGGLNGSQSSAVQTTFTVIGTNLKVNAAGEEVDANGLSTGNCPFRAKDEDRLKMFYASASAAKSGGDPDGCPYASGQNKEKIYLSRCNVFYHTQSLHSVTALAKHAHPNKKIIFCDLAADGTRQYAAAQEFGERMPMLDAARTASYLATETTTSDNAVVNHDLWKEQQDAKAAKALEERKCYSDSKDRIGAYFAQRQEKLCYDTMKDIVSNFKMERITQVTDSFGRDIAVCISGSIWTSALCIGKVLITHAVDLLKLVSDLEKIFNDASKSCGTILPGLTELNSYISTVTDTLSCQGLANLVERQLTQCIRVDWGFDLKLPQFSLALQCPININISARLSPSGFTCYNSVSVGSPIQSSYNGQSFLSGNGGLANLFNPDCHGGFTKASNGTASGGFTNDTTGQAAGTRIPGVDCGPLDTAALKNQSINGMIFLAGGKTSDGWIAGASEIISVPAVDGSGNVQVDPKTNKVITKQTNLSVTRCDFYQSGRMVRKAYVFGTGASCNAGANGFLDGGFETNTACYSNGYTPLSAPNVPDACLYPAACLDSNGAYQSSKSGVSGCPTNPTPSFDASRTYSTFTSGGISGGQQTAQKCSDFSAAAQDSVQCCDPQIQDCSKKDANVPLCVCDRGDAKNTIIRDATGKLDPAGSCVQGGAVTCCSPRLNGQDWCEQNMGNASICADERGDMCTNANTAATYTDAAGKTHQVTAAELLAARPSPYIYLFIRPNGKVNGQECCTTEWCNVCPQHYANAYGLSMSGSPIAQATSDAGNNALLGKGWPFETATNSTNGDTGYRIGTAPLTYTIKVTIKGGSDYELDIRNPYPTLFMSNGMQNKPLAADIDSCNSISRWKTGYTSSDMAGNDMAFSYDYWTGQTIKGRSELHTIGGIPQMQETPMGYINRIRSSMSNGNSTTTTLQPIPLCSDIVKICTTSSGGLSSDLNYGTGTSTGSSNTATPTVPATTTPTTVPDDTGTASGGIGGGTVSTGNSGSSGGVKLQTPTDTNINGPSSVPSAGSGQASGSLY